MLSTSSKTFLRVCLAAASCIFVGTAGANTLKGDWPMVNFDARGLRNNPYETILTKDSVKSLQLAWQLDGINLSLYGPFPPPAVASGVIYVAAEDGHLYARDAVTGHRLWTVKLATTYYSPSSPSVVNGIVYVSYWFPTSPDSKGRLRALNAATGATLWTASFEGSVVGSPIVANGRVYQGGGKDSYLYAFDARSGTPLWKSDGLPTGGAGYYGNPAVAKGILYSIVGFSVVAYDSATGNKLWSQQMRPGYGGESVAVQGNNVYANTEGYLSVLQASTGTVEWSGNFPMPDNASFAVGEGSIQAARNGIHFFDTSGVYSNIDGRTGRAFYAQENQIGVQTSPTIANGVLYVGSPAEIGAYDVVSGAPLWSALLPESFTEAPPIVANGMLYVLAGESLYAYGLKN